MTKILRSSFLLFSTIIIYCCPFSSANAIKPDNLYMAQIEVPSNNVADRELALPKALQEVLIKVSGKSDIAEVPAIKNRLLSANAYLQSYSYISRDIAGQKLLYLQITFNSREIRNLLAALNQPHWPENRPLTLAWIAMPDIKQRIFADIKILSSNASENSVLTILQDAALPIGLPIILPAMDLTDVSAVSITNVCNFNLNVLQEASKRYNAEAILIGCVTKDLHGVWQGHWQFYTNGELSSETWETNASNLSSLFAAAMDNVFKDLGKLFAEPINATAATNTTLHISDVHGLDEYAAISKYIHSLQSVSQVNLLEINQDSVTLSVTNKGGKSALQDLIKSSKQLISVSSITNPVEITTSKTTDILYYRWAFTQHH